MSLIEHLTIDVCEALPYFYAFPGCDTVSSLNGKSKCTFFDTWMESKKENDLTKTFVKLENMPEWINSDNKNTLEFIVKTVYLWYVKDIENVSLNEMSKRQFTQSISNYLKKIALSSDVKQQRVWHVNVPSLVSHACHSVYATESVSIN